MLLRTLCVALTVLLVTHTSPCIAEQSGIHHSYGGIQYRLTRLAGLQPDADMLPRAINDRGVIVGQAFDVDSELRAVIWYRGDITVIAGSPEQMPSDAVALNDRNQIVGISSTPAGWRGYVWHQGRILNVGELPGGPAWSTAQDINNRGEVLGYSDTNVGREGFIWRRGRMVSIGDLPGGSIDNTPMMINDRGVAVGFGSTDGGWRAFLWRNGVMRELGVLSGHVESYAVAVNNRGDIIGASADATGLTKGVIWRAGKIAEIPMAGLDSEFMTVGAIGINDSRVMVGYATRPIPNQENYTETIATIWYSGTAHVLHDLIALSDPLKPYVKLYWAAGINNRGQIIALGTDTRDLSSRSYLLTPVHH